MELEAKQAMLAQLLGEDDVEDDVRSKDFDGAYGIGSWPDAVLESVSPQDKNEYGYQITLKFDLLGIGGGKSFTHFQAVPSSTDEEYWQDRNANNLASIMHAGGLLAKGKKPKPISDQAGYDKLVAAFNLAIGDKFPLKVTPNPKNAKKVYVWGLGGSKK